MSIKRLRDYDASDIIWSSNAARDRHSLDSNWILSEKEGLARTGFDRCSSTVRTYPERYAQEALGDASAAIHRAYAKSARVELPPLEEYERDKSKVVQMPKAA